MFQFLFGNSKDDLRGLLPEDLLSQIQPGAKANMPHGHSAASHGGQPQRFHGAAAARMAQNKFSGHPGIARQHPSTMPQNFPRGLRPPNGVPPGYHQAIPGGSQHGVPGNSADYRSNGASGMPQHAMIPMAGRGGDFPNPNMWQHAAAGMHAVEAAGGYPEVEVSTRGPKKRGRKSSKKEDDAANIGRRQARNRISAKRSRLRKESYMDSLKAANRKLEVENSIMRQYLQQVTGQRIFIRNAKLSLQGSEVPDRVTEFNGEGICLVRTLKRTEKSFVLTDARQPDNPITYASNHFFRLTGYAQNEVLGRNCRFLQGPLTSSRTVVRIRNGISRGQDVATTFINYKSNAKPFWNQLFIFPLRDENGIIGNYVGIQSEVKDQAVIAEV